jgi:hypothetical protein
VKKPTGSYPHVRVQGDGRAVVSQAGSVLLVETVRKTGLDAAISAALAPWRKPRAIHDPGKTLVDLALAVALGGDCLADIALLRSEPAVFGPVASDPTVPRLIGTLAASGEKALTAIHAARSEVRRQVWELVDDRAPDAGGQRNGPPTPSAAHLRRFHGLRPDFGGSALPIPAPRDGPLTTPQASLHATDRCFAPPYRAFDTGLRRRAFPPDAASLLPGLLAATRTGLPPAGDNELTTEDHLRHQDLQSAGRAKARG